MSSIPPPPIRAFYDSDGKIRKDRVYGYLNSLFGATEPNYTRKITFKLPSLAVPAIFNEPTQRVLVDENNLDSNIKPFTLYQFFDDEAYSPENLELYENMKVGERLKMEEGQVIKKRVIIKSVNSAGRFVFIVPSRINSEIMTLFTRQSSSGFLRGNTQSWITSDTKLSDIFQGRERGFGINPPKVYTQYLFRIGSKRYPTYKVLSPTNPKTRTLNYSETGFQT